MHVLQVYKDYFPVLGGIENHLQLLSEGLVARGVRVTVLVTNLTPWTRLERRRGVRVIRAGRQVHLASTPFGVDLIRWARRLRPDLIHLHHPYPPGDLIPLLHRGIPYVVTYHSDVVRQKRLLLLYRPLQAWTLRRAARILPTSPRYVATSPALRRVADRCTVVPLGIPVERYLEPNPAALEKIRRRFGPGPWLLFVGRLRHYKGIDVLLEAMLRLPPRVKLWVIGTGPMGPRWQARARELGLEGRVHFLGEVMGRIVEAFYAAADLFVLPSTSRAEAYGVVQMEAMAAGTPVVCTELGTGTSFVNLDGVTGRVVPPRDPDALAQAIRELLEDDERRARMGRAARERALEEFSADRMVERVFRVYRDILSDFPDAVYFHPNPTWWGMEVPGRSPRPSGRRGEERSVHSWPLGPRPRANWPGSS